MTDQLSDARGVPPAGAFWEVWPVAQGKTTPSTEGNKAWVTDEVQPLLKKLADSLVQSPGKDAKQEREHIEAAQNVVADNGWTNQLQDIWYDYLVSAPNVKAAKRIEVQYTSGLSITSASAFFVGKIDKADNLPDEVEPGNVSFSGTAPSLWAEATLTERQKDERNSGRDLTFADLEENAKKMSKWLDDHSTETSRSVNRYLDLRWLQDGRLPTIRRKYVYAPLD